MNKIPRPKAPSPMLEHIRRDYLLEDMKPIKFQPHQWRILRHMFTPRGRVGDLPFRTCVWSCPKKSGKTELAAMCMYGFSLVMGGNTDLLSVANDVRQAKDRAFSRLSRMLTRMHKINPKRYDQVVNKSPTSDTIELIADDGNIATIRAIPCDPEGEAGGMFSLTVWDELWGYQGDRLNLLWSELQPIPTLKHSMRLVVTYAGFRSTSELLWSIYEQACQPDGEGVEQAPLNPDLAPLPVYDHDSLCVYWDHVARMPWHTPEFLEAARTDPTMKLRESDYLRLWHNQWSTGDEMFIDEAVLERGALEGERLGLYNRMTQHFV